jgi:phosphonate transport system substrate-binding protein
MLSGGLMKKTLVISIFLLAFLAGVGYAETTFHGKEKESGSFLMGLIPEHNIFKQMERYEPLADYISSKTGLRIKLMILSRYGNIVDNFVSSGMDGAFFGSFTYALAHTRLGVQVLARPESPDGTSTYHGLMFVRKDSGIREAQDMKGRRFAFVDKATTAGYLLPLAYFKKNGIKDYRRYLGETYFTGTHEDAIYDVLNGRADIGAAKNTVYQRIAENDSRIMEELVVLERSPDVPENGLAVRSDLDDALKGKLKKVLLGMHEDPRGREVLENFGAARFIETTVSDYEAVFDYARQIELDLSTYDYIND